MTFSEKLRVLSKDVNKARASMSAGLAPTTISNYMATSSIPRGDIALKISRAIGVSLEWMLDDSQGMPAVLGGTPAADEPVITPEDCARKIIRHAATTLTGPALYLALRGASDALAMNREKL